MKPNKFKKGPRSITFASCIALAEFLNAQNVVLRYTKEEAAMLFDLLHSERERLMSLNTRIRLSKEPIFNQEQAEYFHKIMEFCANQMKILSAYADIGGSNGKY